MDPRILELAARCGLPADVLADAVEAGRAAVRAFPHRKPADVAKYVELPACLLDRARA